MRLPQRFKRVPDQDQGEDRDTILLPYPSQTQLDSQSNMEIAHSGSFQSMRTDTAGTYSTVGHTNSHPKSLVERLEDLEYRHFGTRILSFFYNNSVAGWRAGLLRAFLLSLSALIINISIYAWLFVTYNPVHGSGTITTAHCSEVSRMETGIKLGLNIFSTLILSASTFAMQGTTSPTREDVDRAHLKGEWLEIGTQSWRNLIHVSKRNAGIWGVLAITSLPLHLVFNAVFFTTTETYHSAVAVVNQEFMNNTMFQVTSENASPNLWHQDQWTYPKDKCDGDVCSWDIRNDTTVIQLLDNVRNPNKTQAFKRLEPQECIDSYTEGFMQSYSDVVVVSNDTQVDTPVLWTRYPQSTLTTDKEDTHPDPFHWVCHDVLKNTTTGTDRCSKRFALRNVQSKSWTVYGHPVDYCFARIEPKLCHLQYNAHIMLGVIIFSVIKVLAIAFLVFTHPPQSSLRTIGDAVTSFLKKPDPTTHGMCLVASAQIRKHGFTRKSVAFTNARPRWWTGANTTEFFSTIGISASYVVILCGSLWHAMNEADGTAFDNGLGEANIQSLAPLGPDDTGSSGIVPALITANIPQLGFSLLYVFYTNIWCKLLIADEFDRLTREKKGLRISERPHGAQRASHFFTLPVRYALPLMAYSALLHWVCSRSLFMVRFDGMDVGQVDPYDRMVRLGYSVTGIITLISLNFALMVVTICIAGFRRLSTGLGEMSMSVVISAACHIRRDEVQPWLKKVQWGDASGDLEESEEHEGQGVRHCAFTSGRAKRPIEGQAYQ